MPNDARISTRLMSRSGSRGAARVHCRSDRWIAGKESPMPHPILNVDALEYRPWGHGERFAAHIGDIGAKIGAQKLGYNVTVVPPGKRAYPAHSHRVNEE